VRENGQPLRAATVPHDRYQSFSWSLVTSTATSEGVALPFATARRALLYLLSSLLFLLHLPAARAATNALTLAEVLAGVTNQYPPLLAALVERDIAAGRLKSAQGTFDFNAFARVFGTPAGYYESGTLDTGFEQFTGLWGSTVFGGYRLTRGDTLPDYDPNRTQGGGEARLGLRVPLLRDGAIDRRRAALYQARLDQELADPLIARQQLDFLRAATVAYYNWQAAGERLRVAESILRVADDRAAALTNQVNSGLVPKIVLADNQRLVVAREIGVTQARRRFEAAGLALSLFLRDAAEEPVVAGRDRLPAALPAPAAPAAQQLAADIDRALDRRPEIARLAIAMQKLEVDRRLARNQLLPNLDAGVSAAQDFGRDIYFDKSEFELQAGVELRVPLQRREAKGRLAEVEGRLAQLENERRFAGDRVRNEVRDAFSALVAAHEQTQQAGLNVRLARELQEAEEERFRRGATDLLALQLREQAAFDAEVLAVDALAEYFRAQADYRAAVAADLPLAARQAAPARP
jgi:outer membrane protein TolC